MPLSTIKPMLAEAEALLVSSHLLEEDELINICAKALGHLDRENEKYCEAIEYCKKFVPHFTEHLEKLMGLLAAPESHPEEGFSLYGEVHAKAFALVEDMALFIREKTLRNGAIASHPLEETVAAYFETCGDWPAGGGMAADAYYNLLPVAVMRDMTKRASTDV